MGRKKPRVSVEEEDQVPKGQGQIEAHLHNDQALSRPLLPLNPVPNAVNHPIISTRFAPNDPRRKASANVAPNNSRQQSLLIKEEMFEYCQPASLSITGNTDALIQLSSTPSYPPNTLPPSFLLSSPPAASFLNVNQLPLAQVTNIPSLGTSIPPNTANIQNATTPVAKPFINTGELIEEDIYLSDGSDWENEKDDKQDEVEGVSCDDMDQSDDEENENQSSNLEGGKKTATMGTNQQVKKKDELEIILTTSKMGLIRKGSMHQQLLLQAQQHTIQSKQWIRGKNPNPRDQNVVTEGEDEEDTSNTQNAMPTDSEDTFGHIKVEEEGDNEESKLANLDPATRAAHLLMEKQKKIFEAKVAARLLESSENAGRDPCLFSKRTAFDIRMDQIEDRPWLRIGGDITDYFNYDLDEDAWVEYAQTQLEVRQELTDASRQKRTPDPTIIPVMPRAPRKQQPRVAVATKTDAKNEDDDDLLLDGDQIIGPSLPNNHGDANKVLIKNETESTPATTTESAARLESDTKAYLTQFVDIGGGAWGAGAIPGSVLAKLIEDQDKIASGKPPPSLHIPPPFPVLNFPPPPPIPAPPLQAKADIPMNPRRAVPPNPPESIEQEADSFMYAAPPGDRNHPFYREPQINRPRNGPGRWGEYNEFPDPMSFPGPMGLPGPVPHKRHDELRGDGFNNFHPGPPNPHLPPHNEYRGPMQNDIGAPGPMPYEREWKGDGYMNMHQGRPPNPRFPPQHRGPMQNDIGHPGAMPYQRHADWRGDGPPLYNDPPFYPGPVMGHQGPPYPDDFDPESNWRRPREEFNPVAPYGGRFPPQGFGNNLRR